MGHSSNSISASSSIPCAGQVLLLLQIVVWYLYCCHSSLFFAVVLSVSFLKRKLNGCLIGFVPGNDSANPGEDVAVASPGPLRIEDALVLLSFKQTFTGGTGHTFRATMLDKDKKVTEPAKATTGRDTPQR